MTFQNIARSNAGKKVQLEIQDTIFSSQKNKNKRANPKL